MKYKIKINVTAIEEIIEIDGGINKLTIDELMDIIVDHHLPRLFGYTDVTLETLEGEVEDEDGNN